MFKLEVLGVRSKLLRLLPVLHQPWLCRHGANGIVPQLGRVGAILRELHDDNLSLQERGFPRFNLLRQDACGQSAKESQQPVRGDDLPSKPCSGRWDMATKSNVCWDPNPPIPGGFKCLFETANGYEWSPTHVL